MKKANVLVMCIVCSAAALAFADKPTKIPFEALKVEVTIPDDWKPIASDKAKTFADPSGNAAVTFAAIPGTKEAMKKAKEVFAQKLEELMSEFTFDGEMQNKTIHGLAYVIGAAHGTLKQESIPVKMVVALIYTPSNQVLFSFGMVATTKSDEIKASLLGIIESVAPLTPLPDKPAEKETAGHQQKREMVTIVRRIVGDRKYDRFVANYKSCFVKEPGWPQGAPCALSALEAFDARYAQPPPGWPEGIAYKPFVEGVTEDEKERRCWYGYSLSFAQFVFEDDKIILRSDPQCPLCVGTPNGPALADIIWEIPVRDIQGKWDGKSMKRIWGDFHDTGSLYISDNRPLDKGLYKQDARYRYDWIKPHE